MRPEWHATAHVGGVNQRQRRGISLQKGLVFGWVVLKDRLLGPVGLRFHETLANVLHMRIAGMTKLLETFHDVQ